MQAKVLIPDVPTAQKPKAEEMKNMESPDYRVRKDRLFRKPSRQSGINLVNVREEEKKEERL